jgi:hypothetical protein
MDLHAGGQVLTGSLLPVKALAFSPPRRAVATAQIKPSSLTYFD